MVAGPADFHGLAVDQQPAIADVGLPESHPLGQLLDHARSLPQFERQRVESGMLRLPGLGRDTGSENSTSARCQAATRTGRGADAASVVRLVRGAGAPPADSVGSGTPALVGATAGVVGGPVSLRVRDPLASACAGFVHDGHAALDGRVAKLGIKPGGHVQGAHVCRGHAKQIHVPENPRQAKSRIRSSCRGDRSRVCAR